MNRPYFPFLFLLLFVAISFANTGCVGKKRFRSELATRDSIAHQLNVRNLELSRDLGQLRLQLAEKTGEANGLREIYDKQVAEIKKLEKEIERLGKQSSSTQQSMNEELRQKETQLAEKERVIANFGEALKRQEDGIEAVLNEFRTALADLPPADFSCEHREYRGIVVLSERQLFKPGTDQFLRSANPLLEKIARVVNDHPELQVQVVGHTDSQAAAKGFANKLDFSVRRAAAAAQSLVGSFYVNGSQVTAAGRADFEPRASNETELGRSQNRRIEIVFQQRVDNLRKLVDGSR